MVPGNASNSISLPKVHEIVVVARDGGEVPQETSAFITVRLTDASAAAVGGGSDVGRPFTTTRRPAASAAAAARQLRLVYFSRKNSVPEDLPVGRPFAKLVLTDAAIVDANVVDFELAHARGRRVFKLFKNSTAAYLTVARELDFEKEPRYDVTGSYLQYLASGYVQVENLLLTLNLHHSWNFDIRTFAMLPTYTVLCQLCRGRIG